MACRAMPEVTVILAFCIARGFEPLRTAMSPVPCGLTHLAESGVMVRVLIESTKWLFTTLLIASALVPAQTGASREEEIWQHRNLGKAFYENPTTPNEAIAEFKKALDLSPDSPREQLNYALALLRTSRTAEALERLLAVQKRAPEIPHTWFNLGIQYKKEGQFDKATVQLERMVKLVPDEAKSHFNLGVLYKQNERFEDAIRELKTAARLDPSLAGPHFQLYNLYRQQAKREEAAAELKEFQRLKKLFEDATIPEDMEWSDYSEIWDPIDMSPLVPVAPKYDVHELATGIDAKTAGMLVLDSEGTGRADLLVWSGGRLSLYRHGEAPPVDAGLKEIAGVISAAAGDFDNDGLPDLCVLTAAGPLLLHNVKGKFEPVKAALPTGRFEKALWVDYDHDHDLDLMLFGEKPALLRNEGSAGFARSVSGEFGAHGLR
jgi:tetratricopeptide (TPR) repeat protein